MVDCLLMVGRYVSGGGGGCLLHGLGSLEEQLEESGDLWPGPRPAMLVDCLRRRPRRERRTGLMSRSPERSGLKCERESRLEREAESGLKESRLAFLPVSSTSGLSAIGCEPRRPDPPGGRLSS